MGQQLRMRIQMKVQTALETRQHLVSSQDSLTHVSLSEEQPSPTGSTSEGAGEYEFVSPQHVAIIVQCYSSK